jgi:hydroxypyruvate reductase
MFADRPRLERSPRHALALDCVAAGIEAAHPERVIRESVRVDGDDLVVGDRRIALAGVDRLLVLGGGKAAGTAAAALEAVLGDRIDGGLVVTDTPADTDRIEVREGTHPVPGERNVAHTGELLALARSATADDLVLAPITGGGSALLTAPADGIGLADLQATTEALLESGATIDGINAVRRRLSTVKGGGLARAAAPARVVGIVFSDVAGDDPATVASGPTLPDPPRRDAPAVLDRYDLSVPGAVREHLAGGGGTPEQEPAPDTTNVVVADGLTALDAAAGAASERGYEPLVLSARIRGEAREAAKTHVAVAEECRASGHPVEPPVVVLSGGEVTVADPGEAVGGPNLEFGLAAGLELEAGVLASVDTDGIDGSSPAAGALVDGDTVEDPGPGRDALDAHASHDYLAARDAAVETGPTGTNVNDLRALVVDS